MLITKVKRLADTGQITWTEVEPPQPKAMRAFQGVAEGFMLLVQQGNISNVGETPHLEYHAGGMFNGTVEGKPVMIVLHFNNTEADALYHRAAAGRN